jgi:hypothetical protein
MLSQAIVVVGERIRLVIELDKQRSIRLISRRVVVVVVIVVVVVCVVGVVVVVHGVGPSLRSNCRRVRLLLKIRKHRACPRLTERAATVAATGSLCEYIRNRLLLRKLLLRLLLLTKTTATTSIRRRCSVRYRCTTATSTASNGTASTATMIVVISMHRIIGSTTKRNRSTAASTSASASP